MKRHPSLVTMPVKRNGIQLSFLSHRSKRQYPLSGNRLAAVARHLEAHGLGSPPEIGRMRNLDGLTLLRPDRHRLLILGSRAHPCLDDAPEFDGANPVDLGDYWDEIELRGISLAVALRYVLPMQLPVGTVLRTGLEEIPVMAARPSEMVAWLSVPRSFAQSAFEHLAGHLPEEEIA